MHAPHTPPLVSPSNDPARINSSPTTKGDLKEQDGNKLTIRSGLAAPGHLQLAIPPADKTVVPDYTWPALARGAIWGCKRQSQGDSTLHNYSLTLESLFKLPLLRIPETGWTIVGHCCCYTTSTYTIKNNNHSATSIVATYT